MKELKPRITDQQFKQRLLEDLNKGTQEAHKPTNFFALLQTEFSIDKRRALKLHKKIYSDWWCATTDETVREIKSTAASNAQSDLQTRQQMVDFYQKEISAMQAQLMGKSRFTFCAGNKIMNSHNGDTFVVPLQVQISLRRVIMEYSAEICKLQGHYAPTKVAATDTEGNDFDTSALSANDRAALVLMAGKIFR